MSKTPVLLLFAAPFAAALPVPRRLQQAVCPPPGFDSAPDFDLARYISAPW
jgi:hypothetical protein